MNLEFKGEVVLHNATSEQINRKIKDILIQRIEEEIFFDDSCVEFMNKNEKNKYWTHDLIALANYFCEKCFKVTTLDNQA